MARLETMRMRERTAVLWSETGKTPSRSARLVEAATQDFQAHEYDTARARASRSPAGDRASVGGSAGLTRGAKGSARADLIAR